MEIYFDYENEFETQILTKYNDHFDGMIILDFMPQRKLVKIFGDENNINDFLDKILNLKFDDLSIYQLFSGLIFNYMLDENNNIESKIKKLVQLPKYLLVCSEHDLFGTYFLHEKNYVPLSYGEFSDDVNTINQDLGKVFGEDVSFNYEKSKFVFVDYGKHLEHYKNFAKFCLEK